jgi:hypothetical protein
MLSSTESVDPGFSGKSGVVRGKNARIPSEAVGAASEDEALMLEDEVLLLEAPERSRHRSEAAGACCKRHLIRDGDGTSRRSTSVS